MIGTHLLSDFAAGHPEGTCVIDWWIRILCLLLLIWRGGYGDFGGLTSTTKPQGEGRGGEGVTVTMEMG